jgi:beta-glucosidase
VIGETPYAEYLGDRTDLSISQTDVDLLKKMKGYGAPVVVILVSGRPLILEKILHFSDVIIAAWLPGTEGDGIAEVLFGDYHIRGPRVCHNFRSISVIIFILPYMNMDLELIL